MAQCKTYWRKPKIKHGTRASAEIHLAMQEARGLHNHKMQVYRCTNCLFWHIGRMPTPGHIKYREKMINAHDEALVGKLIQAIKNAVGDKRNRA